MHYNVTIEAMAPYTNKIIWPSLARMNKFNIARYDHAIERHWHALYECLNGNALLDRPIAQNAYKFHQEIGSLLFNKTFKRNWRYAFEIREIIITLETWDN